MNGKFDIENNTKPTNKDITVVFSPSLNVASYKYYVYNDDVLIEEKNIDNNLETAIKLDKTGNFKIVVNLTLKDSTLETVTSGIYKIDKEKPVITLTKQNKTIKCTATDNYGNVTVTDNMDDLTLNIKGKYTYFCEAKDEAGNITTKEALINVTNSDTSIFIVQTICIICLFFIICHIIKLIRVIKLEDRLDPFTIKPLKENELSFIDKLIIIYNKFTSVFNKFFKKSELASKYAKKLEKYTVVTKAHDTGYDILSGKLIIAILFTFLALFTKAMQFKILTNDETLCIFTLSFFILDVYLFIKYKIFNWKLESDFMVAITIMNNAFKSGRSITQAIDIVSEEVDGVVGHEFKRMSLELLYGLSIDTVFKRFAERTQIEEANYLTASLTILNKTGGDIIKVFSSIERSLFDKRKLRLELKSLTSGSKIVVYVLLGIPFFFVLVISLLSPTYFLPFINTSIGRILLIFMIIYYIIFVVVVRKIMRVVI